ncbi:MAG: MarR family transcriptional regulator [Candidatus Aenigmatarchaeota archaeon]
MKLYLLVAIFLFTATAHAAITNWNVDISINDDTGTDWTVLLTYDNITDRSDYFVLSKITNVEVFADNKLVNCDITQDIGTSIVCTDLQTKDVTYKFHVKGLVDNVQKLKIFHYPFSVITTVEKMQITVKFPLGSALVEDIELNGTGLKQFEPDFGREGSDGRRIFINWVFDRPALGQTLNISAIYELVSGFDPFTTFAIILVLIIVSFILLLTFVFRKQRVKDLLPVLTNGERKAMEILLREKGEVDQRVIVKETDFSKAKVSRIINDLIERGLIEKISKGRKNLIKLKKEIKRPESKSEKKPE